MSKNYSYLATSNDYFQKWKIHFCCNFYISIGTLKTTQAQMLKKNSIPKDCWTILYCEKFPLNIICLYEIPCLKSSCQTCRDCLYSTENNLYWVDAQGDTVSVIDLATRAITVLMEEPGAHYFSVEVSGEFLYVGDWKKK